MIQRNSSAQNFLYGRNNNNRTMISFLLIDCIQKIHKLGIYFYSFYESHADNIKLFDFFSNKKPSVLSRKKTGSTKYTPLYKDYREMA